MYGPIGADARRLSDDLGVARAGPPPTDPGMAARWSAALSKIRAAATRLAAAASSADSSQTINALEQMDRADLALTPFTRA